MIHLIGRQDIKNRILRKTTDAFSEDPLRVYRVARFAATLSINLQDNSINLQNSEEDIKKIGSKHTLGKENNCTEGSFIVEEETLKAMNSLKNELLTLSKERVFTEFRKALSSSKPSIFFEVLKQADVLDVHFKEISQLIGQIQPEKYHPEGDSYIHTMIVVDNSAKLTGDLAVRFSCLVHDLGKGVTPKEILPHHYGHDEKGVKLVQDLGHRIGIPNSWMKCGKTACKWHMKAGIFEKMTPQKQVDLIENVGKSILGLEGLRIVVACDKNRENLVNTFNNIKFASLGEQCLKEVNRRYDSGEVFKLNRKRFRRQATSRKN